jgi:hypothetical protein
MSVATRISISAVAITRSLAPTVCGVLPVVGTTVASAKDLPSPASVSARRSYAGGGRQ